MTTRKPYQVQTGMDRAAVSVETTVAAAPGEAAFSLTRRGFLLWLLLVLGALGAVAVGGTASQLRGTMAAFLGLSVLFIVLNLSTDRPHPPQSRTLEFSIDARGVSHHGRAVQIRVFAHHIQVDDKTHRLTRPLTTDERAELHNLLSARDRGSRADVPHELEQLQ